MQFLSKRKLTYLRDCLINNATIEQSEQVNWRWHRQQRSEQHWRVNTTQHLPQQSSLLSTGFHTLEYHAFPSPLRVFYFENAVHEQLKFFTQRAKKSHPPLLCIEILKSVHLERNSGERLNENKWNWKLGVLYFSSWHSNLKYLKLIAHFPH